MNLIEHLVQPPDLTVRKQAERWCALPTLDLNLNGLLGFTAWTVLGSPQPLWSLDTKPIRRKGESYFLKTHCFIPWVNRDDLISLLKEGRKDLPAGQLRSHSGQDHCLRAESHPRPESNIKQSREQRASASKLGTCGSSRVSLPGVLSLLLSTNVIPINLV